MLVIDTVREIDSVVWVANALNGVEALDLLESAENSQELPYLVIMGIIIPQMNGKQALVLLKQDSILQDIPQVLFIIPSGLADKAFAEQHGVEFVTKHVKHSELHQNGQAVAYLLYSIVTVS